MHGSPAIVFYPSWLTPRSIRSSVGRSRFGGFELSHIAQLASSPVTRPHRQLSGLIHKLIRKSFEVLAFYGYTSSKRGHMVDCGVLGVRQLMAVVLLTGTVCGCVLDGTLSQNAPDPSVPAITPTVEEPTDLKFLPSDESRKLGLEHFNRGDYGTAERYFRDAVEKAPRDSTAWVGLAASYDRIGRFDLADRAYRSAIKLVGETTEILNNLGYSYMLRGQFATARRYMMKAYKREPNDPTIANNVQLLDSLILRTSR
jgi:tetratricopeptide (TPR) repeat protein